MRWLLPLLALAACDRAAKEPTRVPLNDTVPALAEPPPRAATQDRPGRDGGVTERMGIPEIAGLPTARGQWSSTATEARFGTSFSIRCDQSARTLVITRFGVAGDSLQILADRGANLFSASRDGNATVARFPASFPWFEDVLAKASGDFGVRVGGGEPLVIPADPSIGVVVRRCRASQRE